jgi:phosphatidylserine decarboxylase
MGFDRAGWPFVLVFLAAAFIAGWWLGRLWSVPFLVLAGFMLFFFRDPERTVPTAPDLVVAPADGRVMIAGAARAGAPPGTWQQISIFLSPMDVHVNRSPVDGRITRVDYHAGRFLPAYRDDAGQLNEWTEVWLDHRGQPIVIRQIVGILARRIVTRLAVGQSIARGERFGIMKFGSRIDLFLPASAKIVATVGARVVAGESTLATLTPVTTSAAVEAVP